MRKVTTCDICKQLPTPFETDQGIMHWIIFEEECDDPVYLMSSGDLAFQCTEDVKPILRDNERCMCIHCLEIEEETYGDFSF